MFTFAVLWVLIELSIIIIFHAYWHSFFCFYELSVHVLCSFSIALQSSVQMFGILLFSPFWSSMTPFHTSSCFCAHTKVGGPVLFPLLFLLELSNPYRTLTTLPQWNLKRSRDHDCLVSITNCPTLPRNEGAPGTSSAQIGTVLSKPKWSVTLRVRCSLKGILAQFSVLSFIRQLFEVRVATCIDTLELIKWTANPRTVPFPAVLLPNPFHPFGRFLCSSVSRELST